MCKHEHQEGFAFCPWCGEKLPAPQTKEQEPPANCFEPIPDHCRLNQSVTKNCFNNNYAYSSDDEFNPTRSTITWSAYSNARLQRVVLDAIYIIYHFSDVQFTQADVTAAFDGTEEKHVTCTLLWNAGLLERVGKNATLVYIEALGRSVKREAYVYEVVPDAKEYLRRIVFGLYSDAEKEYKRAKSDYEERLMNMSDRVDQTQSLWYMLS